MIEEFFSLKNGTIVHIREARVEDAERLHTFYKAVTAETEFLITKPNEVFSVMEERGLIRIYQSSYNRLYLVAFHGPEVIATLKIAGGRRKRLSHSGELSIAVRKKYWGQGLGRRLMELGLDWAKDVLKRVELNVVDSNERAIKLYESMGFQVEGVKRKAVNLQDGFHDVYMMAKIF
jgi:RimJ/RimL family protein N-acetyltransferase